MRFFFFAFSVNEANSFSLTRLKNKKSSQDGDAPHDDEEVRDEDASSHVDEEGRGPEDDAPHAPLHEEVNAWRSLAFKLH